MGRVIVVGGGLAGLAAAVALGERGHSVRLLESRPRLGGRASSFEDTDSGQLIDACQHVSMGCCTNFAHLCRTLGVEHLLERQPTLWFVTPDRRVSRFEADPVPAPLHLSRALALAHYLTAGEKLRLLYGMAALMRLSPERDQPLGPFLARHGQTERIVRRFWGLILVSALNESVDGVGTKYARKVFADGFFRHRRAFEVHVPRVPLARLYGDDLSGWLNAHPVSVETGRGVRTLALSSDGSAVAGVGTRDGETLEADAVVLAVPFDRVAPLVPEALRPRAPWLAGLAELEPSPITSVHLWYDRRVLFRPHLVLIDCEGQWLFDRGPTPAGGQYVQVVVSASGDLRRLGHAEVARRIAVEVARLLPAAASATLERSRVVTEVAATFRPVPGVDRLRPPQRTDIPGLTLAGDWTDTGWPATMEGAVRSGYRAAEAVMSALGTPGRIERPDLGE